MVAQIHDKQKELPEDVGEDFSKAESFHRMHAAFERDITTLGKQVIHTKGPFTQWERTRQWPEGNFDDSYLEGGRECCNVWVTVRSFLKR